VPPEDYAAFQDVDFPLPATWSDIPDPHSDRFADPGRWLEFWKPRIPDFQRVYYAMTRNLDRNVGRLMAALEELKLADDTIVVFTSDHGEMFGAHGRVAKLIFYEEAIRVPFLIRWPGQIPAGHVSDACLGTPDILPTLLSMMGLPVPRDVEGVDLSHLARGRGGPEPEAALLQGMGHTYLWKDGHEWRGLRDRRYTYAIYRIDKAEFLFDNQADPLQTKNLASDPAHRDTLERFRRMLKSRMAELNDTFEACTWYRDHWSVDRNIIRGARGGTHDLAQLRRIIQEHFPAATGPN
jgi:arylsulfatase A-like enzyme